MIYIQSAEAISSVRNNGRVCPETTSTDVSKPVPSVSPSRPNTIREGVRVNSDIDIELRYRSISLSSSLLLRTTNQGRKEDKATANRVGRGWSYATPGNKGSGGVPA